MRAAVLHLTRIALVFCCAISQVRAAEGFTVGLHLVTAHYGASDMQGRNPGVYVHAHSGPFAGMTVGTYRNSYARRSTYLAYTWHSSDQRYALTAGAVTGYSLARVLPMLVPSVRFPLTGGTALRASFLFNPMSKGHGSGLHLSVEQEF